jgi:tellurite resistance protein
MKEKSKVDQAAKQMADIAMEHLPKLPSQDREARIKAFNKIAKAPDSPSKTGRIEQTREIRRASRAL